jgi:HPt (histidine-containing phosphotransfer) domain-containing protein
MKLAGDTATRVTVPPGEAIAAAIDVAHLARMTMGEARLEHEVLTLFERQAGILLARMQNAAPPAVAAFAHTLKGSARGIGAWRVAEAAGALEAQAARPHCTAAADALAQLAAAVAEVRALIADLPQPGC